MPVYCGHVYCLHLPIAGKDKLLVPAFVHPDNDRVRFFVINSKLTDYQARKPELLNHAIPILQAKNAGFLAYDSWLVCHELVGGYTAAQIDAIKGCYRGSLDNGTLTIARTLIQGSRLYSERDKQLFLSQWPA